MANSVADIDQTWEPPARLLDRARELAGRLLHGIPLHSLRHSCQGEISKILEGGFGGCGSAGLVVEAFAYLILY